MGSSGLSPWTRRALGATGAKPWMGEQMSVVRGRCHKFCPIYCSHTHWVALGTLVWLWMVLEFPHKRFQLHSQFSCGCVPLIVGRGCVVFLTFIPWTLAFQNVSLGWCGIRWHIGKEAGNVWKPAAESLMSLLFHSTKHLYTTSRFSCIRNYLYLVGFLSKSSFWSLFFLFHHGKVNGSGTSATKAFPLELLLVFCFKNFPRGLCRGGGRSVRFSSDSGE